MLQAGVRGLSRSLAAICRHIAVQIVTQEDARLRGDTVSSDHSRTALLVATPPNAAHAHQLTPDLASAPSAHLHPFHQPASHAGAASHSVAAAGAELQQASSSMSEGYSEMNSGWDVTALPSAGGLSWGSLWGGLKGAQVPPRASGGHSQAHRSAPQHSRGRHEHSDLLRQDPAATTTEQVQQQMPLSNPYGGMNADMVGAEQPALPCITVTAELIEDVLGPRKYDELDPADSLMSPGQLLLLCICSVVQPPMWLPCIGFFSPCIGVSGQGHCKLSLTALLSVSSSCLSMQHGVAPSMC